MAGHDIPRDAHDQPRRDLGRSFVIQALAISALLSLLATGVQLYLAYERGRNEVLATGAELDRSFRGGLETALWDFNFSLAEALLDGVANRDTVRFAILRSAEGREWIRGDPDGVIVEEVVLNFGHAGAGDARVDLGALHIGLSIDAVNSRVWAQFWTILFSNLAKTALAAILLLALFNWRVTRHLQAISDYVGSASWLESSAPLKLERQHDRPSDELDLIASAITQAKQSSNGAIATLEAEIAQRKQVERELIHKADVLNTANRAQAEFTYAISHDLKSPTNTIQMLLEEVTSSEEDELSEDTRELLNHARMTSRRMAQLIDDILAYARTIEEPADMVAVDVSKIVTRLVSDMASDIRESEANITVGTLPDVMGSEIQIKLLLQNLLANAMKFRSQERALEITISGGIAKDGTTEIRVKDNGIGIAVEQQGRIFGLFKRLHTHDQHPGSGLGLAICERVMMNLNGQLKVVSRPGEGSEFTAVFPAV